MESCSQLIVKFNGKQITISIMQTDNNNNLFLIVILLLIDVRLIVFIYSKSKICQKVILAYKQKPKKLGNSDLHGFIIDLKITKS